MASRRKGRRLAVQALYSWDVGHPASPNSLLDFSWHESRSDEDLAFPRLLTTGTIEQLPVIDQMISDQLDHWQLDRVAKVDLAILRVGAYSLRFQPDIPAQVTIDEAVELAKELSSDESFRFVNGVLDGIRKRLQRDP
jgi:transcription antitermination protein NusB